MSKSSAVSLRVVNIFLFHFSSWQEARLFGASGGTWKTSGFPPVFAAWFLFHKKTDSYRLCRPALGKDAKAQPNLFLFAHSGLKPLPGLEPDGKVYEPFPHRAAVSVFPEASLPIP